MKNILFITWDGPQVNYLENLFLPIFLALEKKGYKIHIIQYTWGHSNKPELECKKNNVPYIRINVKRNLKPFGEFYTLIKSTPTIKKYIIDNNIDLLMPRSIFPLIPTLLLFKKSKFKIVFDADGLMLDERIDFGSWTSKSLSYKFLRIIERSGLEKSDVVLTRTQKAKNILFNRTNGFFEKDKIKVVSNGRDIEKYKANNNNNNNNNLRSELGISPTDKIIIYAGSMGEQYGLNEMISFYLAIPFAARFIILTNDPNMILDKIKSYQFKKDHIIIRSVEADEVPKYLQIADLGLNFRKESFSMQAVSPIKLGEYLLCGIPVISTKGQGNSEEIINEEGCGYNLNDFSHKEFIKAIEWFTNYQADSNKIREIGVKYFSLEKTIKEYENALDSI